MCGEAWRYTALRVRDMCNQFYSQPLLSAAQLVWLMDLQREIASEPSSKCRHAFCGIHLEPERMVEAIVGFFSAHGSAAAEKFRLAAMAQSSLGFIEEAISGQPCLELKVPLDPNRDVLRTFLTDLNLHVHELLDCESEVAEEYEVKPVQKFPIIDASGVVEDGADALIVARPYRLEDCDKRALARFRWFLVYDGDIEHPVRLIQRIARILAAHEKYYVLLLTSSGLAEKSAQMPRVSVIHDDPDPETGAYMFYSNWDYNAEGT
jgi:hypothetical protein